MSELPSERQLFNVYQHISASPHCVQAGVSPVCPLWKSSGCVSHLLINAVLPATMWRLDFPSVWAVILSPQWFLLQGGETWPALKAWDPHCCGPYNASSPKLSLAAAFGKYSVPTLPYSNRENSPPILWLFWTDECCLVSLASLRNVAWHWLFWFCVFLLHSPYKPVRGWL